MIRPSDKGPGRSRPPRVKQPRSSSGGTPPAGGGKKTGCLAIAVPVVLALSLLAAGVAR